MARRQQVLARSYKTLAIQCVSDVYYDAPQPIIIHTHWREIVFGGKILKIESSSGEIGRRKGLKIPR